MRHKGARCSLSESMFRFIGRSCVASAFTMLGVPPERAELLTRCLFRLSAHFNCNCSHASAGPHHASRCFLHAVGVSSHYELGLFE